MKPISLNDSLLTPKEVCSYLGICRRSLSRWEDKKLIQPIKVNDRVFRYDPEDVAAMIEKLKGQAA